MKKDNFSNSMADKYAYLLNYPACVTDCGREGRILYEYSDAYSEIDMSLRRKKQARKSAYGIVLLVISALFIAWFFTSLIYGLVTEEVAWGVLARHVLPLIIVGICVAILLISYFCAWDKLLRFAYRNNLTRGGDPVTERHNAEIVSSLEQAEKIRPYQTAISITSKYVILWLHGVKYAFDKRLCRAKIEMYDSLCLTILFCDDNLILPLALPRGDIYEIKRAFGGVVEISDYQPALPTKKYGGYSLGSVIGSTILACIIIAVGVGLIVLSRKKIPQLPAFVGVIIIGFGLLAICNTFHYIPFVSKVLLPFVFGLILTVGPAWFLYWLQENVFEGSFSVITLLTHCTEVSVACVFLSSMGLYCLAYVVTKSIQMLKYR